MELFQSNPMKFVLALVFVLALAIVVVWAIKRFGSDRIAASAARGRQPRLGVVDQVDMPDGRRKLMIIRRDNVEHLVMIGGPTDVVVEQNIVRAGNAARDKADPTLGRSLTATETLNRPVALGEGTLFPLQPESNGRTTRAAEEPVQWTWPPHETQPQAPSRAEPRLEKPEMSAKPADAFPAAPREPTFTRPVPPPQAARPAPTPPAPAAAAPVEKIEKPAAVASADENLAEMANRLEASLRRPPEPRATEPPAPLKAEPIVPPALRADPEQRPAPPEQPAKPEASPKAAFESLEEEMASLLGRPPGKT